MQRIGWIDFLRGISMILILIFHTETYYKENNVTPYYIYTSNAILLFYFISGYLFYQNKTFQWQKRILSILRSLLIPYFIFTILLAVPKLLVRQMEISWMEIAVNILTGRASWFIAALIVGELLFTLLLVKTRGKILGLSTAATASVIIYYLIPFNQHNYWQWQDALLVVSFLYFGYIFHRYKECFNKLNKPLYSLLLLLLLILIKIYEYHVDLPMRNIAVECIPLFLADSTIWLLSVVSIINYIPRSRMIEWTGRHSIVYYFLCGGCPLIVSLLLNRIGLPYEGHFYRLLMAFILTYALATALTAAIYKCAPFLTGVRKR